MDSCQIIHVITLLSLDVFRKSHPSCFCQTLLIHLLYFIDLDEKVIIIMKSYLCRFQDRNHRFLFARTHYVVSDLLLIKCCNNKETEMSAGLQHAVNVHVPCPLRVTVEPQCLSPDNIYSSEGKNPSVPRCALVHAELFTEPRAFVNFSAN